MENSVGIEVSSSVFRAVSLGEKGELNDADAQPIKILEPRLDQLTEFLTSLKGKWGAPSAVGIALPGLVDHAAQTVTYSAHIPEHADTDIVAEIESAAGVRPLIENDANAAAWGEFVA